MNRPKILSIMMNDLGSTYYRQFSPFRAMSKVKLPVLPLSAYSIPKDGTLANASIIHLSRLAMNTIAPVNAIKNLQDQGKKVIIDYDDDLINLPEFNPAYDTVSKTETILAIKAADGIVVTNTALASVYRPYAKRITVIPNYIDFDNWPDKEIKTEGIVVIGLTGSPSHIEDWKQVIKPINDIKKRYGGDVWIILGGYDAEYIYRDEFIPWQDVGEYFKVINRFDIGLCPLNSDNFNKRKTPIKAMELGAAKSAVIASPTQYKELVGGDRGIIASSENEWYTAMCTLIDNTKLRQSYGNNLYNVIKTKMDVNKNAMSIYNSLCNLVK